MSSEFHVLCDELEQTANGAVRCGTDLALVSDEDSEIVMGPEALLAPCHGVAANSTELRFLYDDLECRVLHESDSMAQFEA